ncbi:aldose-1-epimerase [Schaalia vaccimaxillae]|uniref:aldose-1-epimerase n=1 Tax=Schaalia vaccimaxillae TaxID=183916 RepID=UPI0003B66F0E|nr:aldose-1-epimerase [Schaalia vaccimaxillae]
MTARTASGTEIVLYSGDYQARIVTVGAGLASLTLDGHDLIIGHRADEIPQGYLGKTLMPWPNRIAHSSYTWEGVEYQLPINEPSTGAALHGLVVWQDWSIIHSDLDSATLGTTIAPQPGYPWPLDVWVTYALDAKRGLSVTLTAKNVGSGPAPYGVSLHPYLTVDLAPTDSYELTAPVATVLLTDEKLNPAGLEPSADHGFDFTETRVVGSTQIDNAFTDLPEGEWTVTLRDPSTGISSSLTSNCRWVQLFTADNIGRTGVAVEPMTCPPNAFNTGEDVIVLAPEEEHTMTFTISGQIPQA